MFDYHKSIATLAEKTHARMMQKSAWGDMEPIEVCGIKVTCADDLQSVRNRFSQCMRSVTFDAIQSAIEGM